MKLDYRHIMLLCAVVVGVLTSGGVRAEESAIKQPITIGLDANYAPLQSVGRATRPTCGQRWLQMCLTALPTWR